MLKVLGSVRNIEKYQINTKLLQENMGEGNIIQKVRLKNVDKTRNYFIEKINQIGLMSKSTKKFMTSNYIQHIRMLASAVTGCFSSSAFISLVVIHIGITSSAVKLKICAITAGIKKYKSRKSNMIK